VASVSGTEGYAEQAESLTRQYESFSFADIHGPELHLIPVAPCRALDVGAGTGRDAAALAAMGHSVVAVEPTGAFRLRAASLHPSPHVQWLDDSLPDLVRVRQRGEQFDLVMLTAVWMLSMKSNGGARCPAWRRWSRPVAS
jgi:protein-L-isoaspartate O-methyltransferase